MVTDSIQEILEHFSFMDESPETFTDIDTAKARLREVINAEPVVYEAKRQKLLNQIESGVTESGITEAFEPFVEAREKFIEAKEIKDEQERATAFEEIRDIELVKGRATTKLHQQAGRLQREAEILGARQDRFLSKNKEEIEQGVQRNIFTLAKFYGFSEDDPEEISEVEDYLDSVGVETDASGRILR